MKIVHLSNTISVRGGGIASVVKNISRHQASTGHDVHIWIVSPISSKLRKESRNLQDDIIVNVKIVSVIELIFAIMKSWVGISSPLKVELNSFEVIHRHGLWTTLSLFGWLVNAEKKNFFLSPHGFLNQEALARSVLRKKIFFFFVERISFNKSAVLIASSEHEMRELLKLTWLREKEIRIVPNGVEDIFFRYNKSEDKKVVTDSSNRIKPQQFLYLGAIERIKGIDVLLAAINGISSKLRARDWTILCVGDGDQIYKNELISYIHEHQLEDLVFFREGIYGDDRIAMYLESRFFVSLSHSENFGITIAESLTLGVPVVVSSRLPWKDVAEEKAGLVVEPNLSSVQQGLLLASSTTDEEYEEYSRNASQFSHDKFKWDSIGLLLIDTYVDFTVVKKL